jgi:hypothetical protein
LVNAIHRTAASTSKTALSAVGTHHTQRTTSAEQKRVKLEFV